MSEEFEVLKEVCQRLEKSGIPYMITGSTAGNLYALPRMTRDIDLVIEIEKKGAARLVEIFKDHFYVDKDSVTEAIENRGMFNIIHNRLLFKIDFIIRKDSPYRKLEFERRRQIQAEGVSLWVVTPEDLILSKLFWAKESFSEMQLGDVRNLLRTLKDIDTRYLAEWVRSLDLKKVYEKVKNE